MTAGDDGRFTASGLRPSLYQVAIERPGAQSLRLFNVLLVNGENDLGAVSLVAGTSESISLDGGIVPGSTGLDAGPPPIAAFISPSISDAAPGASVVLSGARSAGVPPLTYRWRFDTDGGAAPAFSFNDSTSAVNGVFTAPAASAVLPVELTVVDALQRVSAPARAVVRVGQAPVASLTAMGSTSITGGDQVTLLGTGSTAPDGRPIVVYRWRQVTGPPVPEIDLATGTQVTFTAPSVIGPTPLTVELTVTTDIGLTSAAASVTLVLSPPRPWDVAVQVSPASGGSYGPDGGSVVRLTAAVSNPPADAGFTFSWAPAFEGCGLPDGGVDLSCSSAFALSNPTSAQTEFVTPRTDGTRTRDFSVTVRNTADGTERTVRTLVTFTDVRPPACMLHLSPLALRVSCDEPITGPVVFDLGAMPPKVTVVKSDAQVAALLFPPQTVGSQLTVSVQGLTDQAGNAVPTLGGALTVQHEFGPIILSNDTSTEEPRPKWVTLSGIGQPVSRLIVGRRVSGGNRGLWAIDGNAQCFIAPCNMPTLPPSSATIPGAGTAPPLGDIVAAVGDRAYVIVSPNNPVHLAEAQGNQGREVMGAFPMLALAADSQGLQVVTTSPTPGMNGGLQRFRYQPSTGQFASIDSFSAVSPFSSSSIVRLELFSGGNAVVSAVTANGDAAHFVTTSGGPWNQTTLPGIVPSGVSDLKAASFDNGASTVLFVLAAGDLETYGLGLGGSWDSTLSDNLDQGFDVVPYGDDVAIVGSDSGRVVLALIDRKTGTPYLVPSNEMDQAWNGPVGGASAWRPTIQVIDGQLAIAWHEGTSGNWKMAGRIIR
ncbi:MAG: hypothetical protein JNG84_12640 [Archangium sp.]|nr:hypothetical protein [Archangium sp.]